MKIVTSIAKNLLAILTILLFVNTLQAGEKFEPFYVDSLKVKAAGTGGRTVTRKIVISAGPDRVFIPSTIRFVTNSLSGGGAKYHKFLENEYEVVRFPAIVDGATVYLDMPRKIVIYLHAETGSGPGNYNRGAWLNGYVHAETLEINR